MTALAMEVHLRVVACNSLKEKRHRIRPLVEKLRRRFGASAAEIGDNDLWGNARLGIAVVAGSESLANATKERILEFLESLPDFQLQMEMSEIVVL